MKKIFFFTLMLFGLFSHSVGFSRSQDSFNVDSKKEKSVLDPGKFFNALDAAKGNSLENPSIIPAFSDSPSIRLDSGVTLSGYYTLLAEEQYMACRSSLDNGETFAQKISDCPSILNSIVWETPTGSLVHFEDWTAAQKNRINEIYQELLRNEMDLGLSCPNPVRSFQVSAAGAHMYLSAEEAFDVYAAHVAFAVYLEATHGVPWTILNLPQIQLDELFNAQSYHVPIVNNSRVTFPSHILPGRDYQLPYRTKEGLVCDPRVGFNFIQGFTSMSGKNLLGATPLETLGILTYWMKDNVAHTGHVSIPITDLALLEDRLRARMISGQRRIPSESGCHSASNILYDLARSVNIPLLNVDMFETSSSFHTGEMHQGLVAFAGSANVRILYTLDDIMASDLQLIYPITADGRVMGESDAMQTYFQTQWVSFQALNDWGFQASPDFPWLTLPSEGLALNIPENTYPNFGRSIGYWNTYSSTRFSPQRMFQLEKTYQMCGWEMLRDYCTRSPSDFVSNMYNLYLEHPVEYTPPVSRTGNDFYMRANHCFAVYGGCDEIMSLRGMWESDFASTTFR